MPGSLTDEQHSSKLFCTNLATVGKRAQCKRYQCHSHGRIKGATNTDAANIGVDDDIRAAVLFTLGTTRVEENQNEAKQAAEGPEQERKPLESPQCFSSWPEWQPSRPPGALRLGFQEPCGIAYETYACTEYQWDAYQHVESWHLVRHS